ncbi:hypothetical protein Lalb_Chr13g0303621 [Lupinus albus]|uniref:Uncharacterized protein n=1 Tax=Lupinus albus TaxID=3870 RepID=A0A6A4PKJ2_LUPAL|nr:hypothetical protein Lalb_Chr13g0303621 [Lupinus albus]
MVLINFDPPPIFPLIIIITFHCVFLYQKNSLQEFKLLLFNSGSRVPFLHGHAPTINQIFSFIFPKIPISLCFLFSNPLVSSFGSLHRYVYVALLFFIFTFFI